MSCKLTRFLFYSADKKRREQNLQFSSSHARDGNTWNSGSVATLEGRSRDLGMPSGGAQVANHMRAHQSTSRHYQDIHGGGHYGVATSTPNSHLQNSPNNFQSHQTYQSSTPVGNYNSPSMYAAPNSGYRQEGREQGMNTQVQQGFDLEPTPIGAMAPSSQPPQNAAQGYPQQPQQQQPQQQHYQWYQ